MAIQNISTLINPQNGNLAFKIFSFEDHHAFDHLRRHNYYSIILIEQGTCTLKADFAEYALEGAVMLFFAPYQPFMIRTNAPIRGWALHFHSDFFCIHKHDREVSCHGVLFNTIYEPPFLTLDESDAMKFGGFIEQMLEEMQSGETAQYEMLVSHLKIFLIHGTRLKAKQCSALPMLAQEAKEPFILQSLKDAVEQHYRTKHSASEYADMLNISAKTLAKMTKRHFNKTLTEIISERIIIEAKRELYLTSKAVKEIAYELGFNDEHYFSRFFKTNADVSPQMYRDTVGFARAEML